MEYSLFLEPRTSPDPAGHIRKVVEAGELADDLGYSNLWLSVSHFGSLGFSTSGAFPILSVVSEHTGRIQLGTAVVPLTFENPIRVAEDASFLDLLSGGRVQLGLGKGNGHSLSVSSAAAFKTDTRSQDEVFTDNLDILLDILDPTRAPQDEILAGTYPQSNALASRIWGASATPAQITKIAGRGDGLMLYRSGRANSSQLAQAEIIESYRSQFIAHLPGQEARTGLSRSVLPSTSVEAAYDALRADPGHNPHYYTTFGVVQKEYEADPELKTFPDAYFEFMGTALGTPAEVAATLAADPAVRIADNILFNIPLSLENPAYKEAIRLIIQEVVPALQALLVKEDAR